MQTAKRAVLEIQAETGIALTGSDYRDLLTIAIEAVMVSDDLDDAKDALRRALGD